MRPLTAVHLPAIRDTIADNQRRAHRYLRSIATTAPAAARPLIDAQLWNDGTAIAHAGLWWVTPDMTTLSWHTATTSEALPDWDTLDSAHRNGLVVFDGGLPLDVEIPHDDPEVLAALGQTPPPMDTVRVTAIAWHRTADTTKLTFFTADPRMVWGTDDGKWSTPWLANAAPLVVVPHPTPTPDIDAVSLRVITAMLLISAEPTVAQVRPASWSLDAPPKSRRPKEVPAVKVVALREILPPDHHDDNDPTPAGARTYSHRWIVQDHERTYWTGPGGTIKTKRWIAPYVAGPAHRPLVVKESVRVWRR